MGYGTLQCQCAYISIRFLNVCTAFFNDFPSSCHTQTIIKSAIISIRFISVHFNRFIICPNSRLLFLYLCIFAMYCMVLYRMVAPTQFCVLKIDFIISNWRQVSFCDENLPHWWYCCCLWLQIIDNILYSAFHCRSRYLRNCVGSSESNDFTISETSFWNNTLISFFF